MIAVIVLAVFAVAVNVVVGWWAFRRPLSAVDARLAAVDQQLDERGMAA